MRRSAYKKNFVVMILILFVVFLGIGYAYLTENLNISNIVQYNTMVWDVGFSSASDGGGTIASTSSLSDDKKTITVSCDFALSTASETCIVNATTLNNSSFDIMLASDPSITYDNTYIESVNIVWADNTLPVTELNALRVGKSKEMVITITSKELTKDILPETNISVPVVIKFDWVEAEVISFEVSGTTYSAIYGMTWGEWMNSDYNPNSSFASRYGGYVTYFGNYVRNGTNSIADTETIIKNYSYSVDECCFDPGTKILMFDGSLKNIEDVKVGDMVMSLNEETGVYIPQRVKDTIVKRDSNDLVYVYLSDGTRLGMRAYHPLLTTDGWKSLRPKLAETIMDVGEVPMLEIGDTLVGYEKDVKVISIAQRIDIKDYNTYNLNVENTHNYIANGIVAHNVGCK